VHHTRLFYRILGLAASAALFAGCSTNGGSSLPSTSQANIKTNALQLVVGTANIGQDGTTGLNVVATLRQGNGLSGVLANTPTLTGPAGFVVPAGTGGAYSSSKFGPNVDAGTNHISGSPQVPLNNAGLVNSTLGTFTGVFSYGFGPFNSDQTITAGAYYPGNPNASPGNGFGRSNYDGSSFISAQFPPNGLADPTQPLPFFSANPFPYVEGPPAVPFFNDGTFPTAFGGYSPGFTTFELPAVPGSYNLSVNVAASNASPVTYTASATLSNPAVLGPIPMPAFTLDGAGGGSGSVAIPTGVTETMVYVVDVNANSGGESFFTAGPITGTGAQPFTLPDTLGACNGKGCQTGTSAAQSIGPGDTYFVAAVGYDYAAFESGPPGNVQQKPAISSGQADITLSPYLVASDPRPAPSARFRRSPFLVRGIHH
jgi:uncharacterized membrane protein YuzA (DUF378 family)